MLKKKSTILKIIYIVYIFMDIITFLYCAWFTRFLKLIFLKSAKIIFIICSLCILYIYLIIDSKKNIIQRKICQKFILWLFILLNRWLVFIIVIFRTFPDIINCLEYGIYLQTCPFTLFNNDTHLEERVCKLYNINNNSRYRYQYICSYEPNFLQKNQTYIGLDIMKCIPKVKNNTNNNIIEIFSNEHKNKKLYYCSLIKRPQKNNYIKDEYCNKKINLPVLFFFIHLIYFFLIKQHRKILNHIQDITLINLNLNKAQKNNFDFNDSSTQYSDNNNINKISFTQEGDKTIKLENKRK